MNWKFTAVLVAIVVAFYFFFTYYENKQAPIPAAGELPRVFALDRNQIDGLTITDHDQKIDLVRGENNKWTLKAPLTDRADQSLIDQVMTSLEILRKEDTLSGKDATPAKLKDYGLQTPRERLLITAHGGHQTEAVFGNETVLEGKTYMQLKGLADVYVVGNELKKLLDKDVNAWRDHQLTNLTTTDVNRLVIKDGAGEIEVQKDGEHWKLVKPLATRADDTKVKDTISQLTNLGISSFVADDKADAAAYGLAEPKGTITLYTAKDSKGIELLVGNAPVAPAATPTPTPGTSPSAALPSPTPAAPANTVYVRLPSRQAIFTVPNELNNVLALKPADLRDRSLVRVNEDTVDRIRLTLADGATFTLSHKDKTWTILDGPAANQPAEAELVGKVLTLLTGPNIADFVADSASDLAKYGLDKPTLQVKLASFSSENTAETNAGEKPVASILFGKSDNAVVYAKLADEPYVVSVPKALLDELPMEALQWQTTTLFKDDPSKITSLDVALQGRPALALSRADKDKGGWVLNTKLEGALDNTKVESAANTLARLHAVRWVGAAKPDYGLEPAHGTIKFAGASDAKIAGRLVLGVADQTGLTYAQVDGRPGVFQLSRIDSDVLTAELVSGTAAPTPALAPEPPSTTPAPAPVAPPSTPTPAPAATPVPPPTPAATATSTPTPATTPTPEPTATATPTLAPVPPVEATPTPAATEPPAASVAPMAPASSPAPTPEAATSTLAPVATPADIPAPAATPTPEGGNS